MRLLLSAFLLFLNMICFGQDKQFFLFVGGYTTGKSEGISVYRFNAADGSASFVSKVKTDNPSYLAISNNGNYVYCVNETGKGRSGSATAFSFDKKNGSLSLLNNKPVGANGPCYISVDKANKWLFTANYASGSVSVLTLKKDGFIDTLKEVIQHTGNSINKQRQEGPHGHTAIFSSNEKQLFTTDLGTDKINVYQFNSKKLNPLRVTNDSIIASTPGNGPRHIAFHPAKKVLYVINELAGTIDVFENKKGMTLLQTISTDTTNNLDKGCADIHLSDDGKFLYATNRGKYNTIAVFKVDERGKLELLELQPTGGKTPRNFMIDPTGNYLLVAHQNSDSVIVFKRDKETGLLTMTANKIEVGNPSCLKMLAVE